MHRRLHFKNFVFFGKTNWPWTYLDEFLRFLPRSSIFQPGAAMGGGLDCANSSVLDGWSEGRGGSSGKSTTTRPGPPALKIWCYLYPLCIRQKKITMCVIKLRQVEKRELTENAWDLAGLLLSVGNFIQRNKTDRNNLKGKLFVQNVRNFMSVSKNWKETNLQTLMHVSHTLLTHVW